MVRLAVPLMAAGALVAACGGGSGNSSGAAAPKAQPAAHSAAGGGTVIKTSQESGSTFLTDGAGRSIYLWMADKTDKSTCSGACASVWPPVTSKGKPTASGQAVSAKLGLTPRSGGGEQVTYAGHPLYYYAGDTRPGATNGQGSDGFGAKWWLMTPGGAAITTSLNSGSSSTSSGSSSGGYSY